MFLSRVTKIKVIIFDSLTCTSAVLGLRNLTQKEAEEKTKEEAKKKEELGE